MNDNDTSKTLDSPVKDTLSSQYRVEVYEGEWIKGKSPCISGTKAFESKRLLSGLLGFCEENLHFDKFSKMTIDIKSMPDSDNSSDVTAGSVWMVITIGNTRYVVNAVKLQNWNL